MMFCEAPRKGSLTFFIAGCDSRIFNAKRIFFHILSNRDEVNGGFNTPPYFVLKHPL